jgi:hypothetical protein
VSAAVLLGSLPAASASTSAQKPGASFKGLAKQKSLIQTLGTNIGTRFKHSGHFDSDFLALAPDFSLISKALDSNFLARYRSDPEKHYNPASNMISEFGRAADISRECRA